MERGGGIKNMDGLVPIALPAVQSCLECGMVGVCRILTAHFGVVLPRTDGWGPVSLLGEL